MEWQTKMNKLGNTRKVYLQPKLPLSIDAMYENKWGGNLIAYTYDPNPARSNPAYKTLDSVICRRRMNSGRGNYSDKVASHYQEDIFARQMDERTYNLILESSPLALKMMFTFQYLFNKDLRKKIAERHEYMFSDRIEWTDSKFGFGRD